MSPSPSLAGREHDIHARLAPAPGSADRQKLRDEGVPAALRVLVEGIWDRRPVVLFGEDHPASQALWKLLAGVRSRQDWVDWLSFARQSAWGNPVPWSQQVEGWSLEEQRSAWKNARDLLGSPLAEWLQEDEGWTGWYSAAQSRLGDGEDRLERRTRDLDNKRKSARPDPKADLPSRDACTPSAVRSRAENLARRFGLRRLEAAAGMPLWCVAEHLDLAETGLAQLAKAMEWPEARIGASHLGLGWELGPKDMSGGYDPLRHMVYLGREDWHGSFAHEFMHALDRVAADPKLPDHFLSVQRSWNVLLADPPLTHSEQVQAHREMILGFQSTIADWRREFNKPHPQLEALDGALAAWVDEVLDPSQWKPTQRQSWDRWRSRMTLLLTNANKPWVERFDRICDNAARLWESTPTGEGWLAWAKVRDEAQGRRYWAEPHEVWARAGHAVVRSRMEQDGWAASFADRSDLFPCRMELARWTRRFDELKPHLEAKWVMHGQSMRSQNNHSPPSS